MQPITSEQAAVADMGEKAVPLSAVPVPAAVDLAHRAVMPAEMLPAPTRGAAAAAVVDMDTMEKPEQPTTAAAVADILRPDTAQEGTETLLVLPAWLS